MSQYTGRPEDPTRGRRVTAPPRRAEIDDLDDRLRRRATRLRRTVLAGLKELVIVVVLAMALSFVVKTWLFQAFYIPSGSMENTLVKDDRVIVSKLTPGPFDLKRGDVVVFEDPGDAHARGSAASASSAATSAGRSTTPSSSSGCFPRTPRTTSSSASSACPATTSRPTVTPARSASTVSRSPSPTSSRATSRARARSSTSPSGRTIWVMGDHRSDSSDSRWHDDGTGADGSVPMDKIVGRALFVVWPIDHVTWLGVPERTFAQVPAPTTVTDEPSTKPTGKATGTVHGQADRLGDEGPRRADAAGAAPWHAALQEAVPQGRARTPAVGPPAARRHGRGRPRRPRRSGQRRASSSSTRPCARLRSGSRTPSCSPSGPAR